MAGLEHVTHGGAVSAGDVGPGAGLQIGDGSSAAVSPVPTLCGLCVWRGVHPGGQEDPVRPPC